MGLPCIGLRSSPPDVLSSAEEVIQDGVGGFCVSTEAELCARIDLLARDASLRRRMGDAALRRARASYTTDQYVARLKTTIDDLMGTAEG